MICVCDWCKGNRETLPMGMCDLHQHAHEMLSTLDLIHNWYKLGGKSLSPSALIGPSDETVMQMIEDVLRKVAEGH